MNPEDKKRIIDRIRKLLAVTEARGATPNEAASAARMAEATLRKYQLEMKEVILEDLSKGGIEEMWARGTKNKPNMSKKATLPTWAAILAPAVAKLFDVFAKQGHWPEVGHVVIFVGYTLDIEVAKWTYEYLMGQVQLALDRVEADMEATLKELRDKPRTNEKESERLHAALNFFAVPKKGRNTAFREGMVLELVQRLEQLVKDRRAEAAKQQHTSDGKGTALIVMTKKDALARHLGYDPDEGYGETRAKAGKKNLDAYLRGRTEGKKVNLNPNPIDFREDRNQKRLGTKTSAAPVGSVFYPVVMWPSGLTVSRAFTEDTREEAEKIGKELAARNSNGGARYLGTVYGENLAACKEAAEELADTERA